MPMSTCMSKRLWIIWYCTRHDMQVVHGYVQQGVVKTNSVIMHCHRLRQSTWIRFSSRGRACSTDIGLLVIAVMLINDKKGKPIEYVPEMNF